MDDTPVTGFTALPDEILCQIRDIVGHDDLTRYHGIVYDPTMEEAFWTEVARAHGVGKPLESDTTMRLVGSTCSYDILRAFALHIQNCELEVCAKRAEKFYSEYIPDAEGTRIMLNKAIEHEEAYLDWNLSLEDILEDHAITLFSFATSQSIDTIRLELAEDDAFATLIHNSGGVTQSDILRELRRLAIDSSSQLHWRVALRLAQFVHGLGICANLLIEEDSPSGAIAGLAEQAGYQSSDMPDSVSDLLTDSNPLMASFSQTLSAAKLYEILGEYGDEEQKELVRVILPFTTLRHFVTEGNIVLEAFYLRGGRPRGEGDDTPVTITACWTDGSNSS